VSGGGPDDNRDLTDGYSSDPVPEHRRTHLELPTDRAIDGSELSKGGRLVDLVVERHDTASSPPVRPDPTGEEDDTAQAGAVELPSRVCER
jgi:hypothetical protein